MRALPPQSTIVGLACAAVAAATPWNGARACTAVDFRAADGAVVAGRTMEWAFEMGWTLASFPKGSPVTLAAPPGLKLPAHATTTRHAVVGICPASPPGCPLLEGQNAAGLTMSGNFLPGFTEYQSVGPGDTRYVSILSFGLWALGGHASVAELRAALPGIRVWSDASLAPGQAPPTLHFVFVDRTGAGLVVEYVKGELRMHDNAAHVLTNAPTYDWHLVNLRNYLNLTPVGVPGVRIGSADVTALGQGGGMLGVPGDFTPPSRFVRTAFLVRHVTPPADAEGAIQAVGHVLDDVDIPRGVAQGREGGGLVDDYTQFVVIKDLSRNRLLIADHAHRLTFLTLDLDRIFAQPTPASVRIADLPYPAAIDGTRALLR